MSSKIEWTEKTWNPTTGCDRISPGCDRCYALTMAGRLKAMGQADYQNDGDPRTSGPGFALTCHPDRLDTPLHWRKPCKVFVNSMSDLFHRDVPARFIDAVFDTMVRCPQHTFQILTKRPERMASYVSDRAARIVGRSHPGPLALIRWDGSVEVTPPRIPAEAIPNVWLGTSIESDRYTFRARELRATLAAVRFLSLEPLLGPLPSLDLSGIDWVIVGAESGRGARPMDLDWVRDIRDRCAHGSDPCPTCNGDKSIEVDSTPGNRGFAACPTCYDPDGDGPTGRKRIPLFFKQTAVNGRKVAVPELDGRQWAEYPA